MNMHILYLDKYKYSVSVTWDSETDLEEQIPGQILLVNVATKTVKISNGKYDWREWY